LPPNHVVPSTRWFGVAVDWTDGFVARRHGEPLKNVAASVAGVTVRGDVVITRSGLEGGPIYPHSAAIASAVQQGSPSLVLDLWPDVAPSATMQRLERRRSKDSATTWLRRAGLTALQVDLLREVTHNRLPAETADMAALIRAVPVAVQSLMPIDRAISSAGGVRFDELTTDFMLSRLPGVFAAGEMLDWEAPTGGYLLQACFSTGRAAGLGAVQHALG
jgi:predicted flavoprotein YhiN